LEFDRNFNHEIDKKISKTVTHLTFGHYFNRPIKNNIPHAVTHLTFGDYFDQSIQNCIPSSVVYLKFGDNFNQPIENYIPKSVTHLVFGKFFDKSLKRIPVSVIYLTVRRILSTKKRLDSRKRTIHNTIYINIFSLRTINYLLIRILLFCNVI